MKNRIIIICPYYGTLPANIEYTMLTMAKNSFVDWLILTDSEQILPSYTNIKIVKSIYDDLCELIRSRLETDIKSPYKLCDYRPAYGVLFEEYISGYDFWGHCDLDMIFGDLTKCFSEKNLNDYDKIFDQGHLALFRNNSDINTAYKKITCGSMDWKAIFNSPYSFIVDETYHGDHIGINEVLEQDGFRIFRDRTLYIDTIVRYKNLYVLNHSRKGNPYYLYDNGRVLLRYMGCNEQKEYIYAHFQKRKFAEIEPEASEPFVIVPKGFYKRNTVQKGDFYNKLSDLRLFWYIKFRIKRKLSNRKLQAQKG